MKGRPFALGVGVTHRVWVSMWQRPLDSQRSGDAYVHVHVNAYDRNGVIPANASEPIDDSARAGTGASGSYAFT